MARLNCYRPLISLPLARPRRRVVRTMDQSFSTSAPRQRQHDMVDVGLDEKDAIIGPQASEPLTIEGIKVRRAKAGKLVAGTAAYSDSDMFKSPQAFEKPKAKRWDHILSAESAARKPCVLKLAAKHLKKPGLISLGGGLPSADNFPIESLSVRIPKPPYFESTPASASSSSSGTGVGEDARDTITAGKHDVRLNHNGGVYDLATAMNYGQSTGSAQLMRWVTEHAELTLSPPYGDWQCALTIGSTGALEAAFRMLCDGPGRRDSLLTEEYSFSTALETAEPLGITVAGVEMDEQGLLPEALDQIMKTWKPEERGGAAKPRVLYTVPSGQNPTGATMGEERRRQVYKVAQKHDIFIIEDEPYYFLQMPHESDPNGASATPRDIATADISQFLKSLIPSLVSMDTDGRVMRLDSFSKVIIPGSRTGWVTGPAQLIERYIRHAECASQGPSGVSQILLYKMLDEDGWGHEGYLRWLMHLGAEYTRRRDAIIDACRRHLRGGLVHWTPPRAGMFLWLSVDYTQHPDFEQKKKTILEIEEDMFNRCIEAGVLVCRGSWFRAEHDKPPSGLFFRATYAAASEADMDAAIERFGKAVRGSFGK
ncbi:pyridoxal phosphate-dependent transferase [Xylariomycetidae sp. FL0641]|nr:pyridoxal phosphate-dependent transferase [Xylariomycetidae sp. FL0641]